MKIKFTKNNDESIIEITEFPLESNEKEKEDITYVFKDKLLHCMHLFKDAFRQLHKFSLTNLSMEIEVDDKELEYEKYSYIRSNKNIINIFDNIDYVGYCNFKDTERTYRGIVDTIIKLNLNFPYYEHIIRNIVRFEIGILYPSEGEYIILFHQEKFHLFKTKDGGPINRYYGDEFKK